jgi:hypothetical protein
VNTLIIGFIFLLYIQNMKKYFIVSLSLLFLIQVEAKSHGIAPKKSDFLSYIEGKRYRNSDMGLTLQYGYISSFNTYGIKVTNKNNVTFNYINCSVRVAYDDESATFSSCFDPIEQRGGLGTLYAFKTRIISVLEDARLVYELVRDF